jgi:endonuclease G
MEYNEKYRIPDWVAYHIIPDYLNTPVRKGKYKQFRSDPDMAHPVEDKDYDSCGYSRGHMAPYFAMGGDRDKNGVYSNADDNTADPYDDTTIFQANYLSNIAPQDQDAMNGAGGPWYALETLIRKQLVGKQQLELHVVAGSIINDPEQYNTLSGKYGNVGIAVPDSFFQVLIYKNPQGKYITAGFLFPHVEKPSELPSHDLMDYLVTVDLIETVTGLDFLNKLGKVKQRKTESTDNKEFWTSVTQ